MSIGSDHRNVTLKEKFQLALIMILISQINVRQPDAQESF